MLVFTVDVEDWYQTSDFRIPVQDWHHYDKRVKNNTMRLLDLFDEYQAKGTFFILGSVAKDFPELVIEIARRGHEIASHGYWHQMLTTLSFAEIRRELVESKAILEDLSGLPVTCFRAPSWSLAPGRYEVLQILEDTGYHCDSSIQPFRTPLSGVNVKMRAPFYPILNGHKINVLEVPSSTLKVANWNIPFAGGLYLRILPIRLIEWGLHHTLKAHDAMVYVHPWEIDVDQPDISISPLIRFVHYHNLAGTEGKLRSILNHFSTVTMGQLVQLGEFPTYVLA